MGYERIFAFPSGFMKAYPNVVNHLPGGWGIVEFDDKGKAKVIRKGTPFYERNDRAERALLVQGVRKATEGWGRKTFGDLAPEMTDGDPHPTASKVIRELRTILGPIQPSTVPTLDLEPTRQTRTRGYVILVLYACNALRWTVAKSWGDAAYWISAFGITASVTWGFKHG